jgi:regulator of protease activity HflC (stomatin/prohibitin superfamily)
VIKYPWSRTTPPREPKRGFSGFISRHLAGASVGLMVVLLLFFVLYPYMLITVPSGEVGVLWKRFSGPGIGCWCILPRGTVLNPLELRDEGLHIIWPWDKLFLYDLRLQTTTEKGTAISSDGVSVTAEINVRYQLNHQSVAVLHKFIGPGYLKSLVLPEIGSQVRQIVSTYRAQDVYISRDEIQNRLRAATQNSLGEHLNALYQPEASEQDNPERYKDDLARSIKILDTLILSIELPPSIVSAINRQTEQYYQIREYKYRAERETEESKRKLIEANGIAAFQRTVSQGISESYLRWRGIEATLALAQSSNSKIVIIGNGKDGLPIILGNVDSSPSSSAGPKAGDGPAPSSSGTSPTTPSSPRETPAAETQSASPSSTPETPPPGSSPTKPGGAPPTAAPSSPRSDLFAPDKSSAEKPRSGSDSSDIAAILSRLYDALRTAGSAVVSERDSGPK